MNAPQAGAAPIVQACNIVQAYGDKPVLHGVSFSLRPGQVMALLGPSGCGKTTLLRLIAGLLRPSGGALAINGRVVADAADGIFVPPERRGLGMVFQDFALWPHLNVGRNVGFPLEMQGVPRAIRERRVLAALEKVGLGGFAMRRPGDLSGGQQQRVAIARAIIGEARLVLFDEPLSNLDRELRESLVSEIGQLVGELGLSAVYVTHDQAEAFALADTVAVMQGGLIAQLDAPETLVRQPATPAIADFLRLGAVAKVEPRADGWWLADGDRCFLPVLPEQGATLREVLVPRLALQLVPVAAAPLTAQVLASQFQGDRHLVTIRLHGGAPLDMQVISTARAMPGETVGLSIATENLRWFTPAH
jgi:iron(III) transport system ATP-binding protein